MHVNITSRVQAGPGVLLRIPTRETVTETAGGRTIVEKVLEDVYVCFYVCDMNDVTAFEFGDGTVSVSYTGGQRNEFKLHEGTALEIGDQAGPVGNLLELRLV